MIYKQTLGGGLITDGIHWGNPFEVEFTHLSPSDLSLKLSTTTRVLTTTTVIWSTALRLWLSIGPTRNNTKKRRRNSLGSYRKTMQYGNGFRKSYVGKFWFVIAILN